MGKTENVFLGVKSKFGGFLFKHPWYSMIILFLIVELLTFSIEKDIYGVIPPIKIVLPQLVLFTAILQFFTNRNAYKVVIDKEAHTIKFHLMFNKGEFSENIKSVKVVVEHNCKIIVNGNVYVVFVDTLHKLVRFLPKVHIPVHPGHPFHLIPDSDSIRCRTPIPFDRGQGFHSIPDNISKSSCA